MADVDPSTPQPFYIALISIHGLIRGREPELGKDADTGGQITYVLELARALAQHPKVGRVDLLTRQVFDARISPDYAAPEEELGPNCRIIRLPCGPRRYLRKESLWPHLDGYADNVLRHFRAIGRLPDVVHSHYADAGLVGTRLSRLLGVMHAHTGHSLGRVKRERLLEKGLSEEVIESRYNISQRIEAEEIAIGNAAFVVTSTHQEVDEQYAAYDDYQPRRMVVIPPGVDLSRFHPPGRMAFHPPIREKLRRFLREPNRPMILALARADERKNLATLVRAFGESPRLRALANLVIVAGQRVDIQSMDRGTREVLTRLLLLMDRYDLYGKLALPKEHEADDVPDLYQLAAKSRGVFVNPALTEPFGLTLIEAAASGVPLVATNDGGPNEIIANCKNGLLIDPLDVAGMQSALVDALSHRLQWRRWSRSGVQGAHKHYSWQGHVEKYLRVMEQALKREESRKFPSQITRKYSLPTADRLLVCDIDNTLIGDRKGLCALLNILVEGGDKVGFGVATGRNLKGTLAVLKEWNVPVPDFMITSVGSVIHYRQGMVEDTGWAKHIDYRWDREGVLEAMAELPGLRPQPKEEQGPHKISYFVDSEKVPTKKKILQYLRKRDLHARVIFSHQEFLDLLPLRASKGLAITHLAIKWGLPLERILVAGDSGNDEEMLKENMLGLVVGNHHSELDHLQGQPRIYFAEEPHAWGILEGINHYHFLGNIRIPEEEQGRDD
ncbi:MAG: HAD-IIB family hydrolase [Magnetococcales bacterium]|nr:HAD-IIB family hydrolase [Magnetococcales bacterium]